MKPTSQRLSTAWGGMLIFTYAVILWGTFVRTSRSGDGCGQNWPHCEGGYWADFNNLAQVIEFIHRASTGVYGLLALGLVFYTIRKKPGRTAWILSIGFLFFLLLEALIGRILVVEGYVVDDARLMRLLWMGLHFLNTLSLTTWVVFLWRWTRKATTFKPLRRAKALVKNVWLWVFLGVSMLGIVASMYDSTVILGGKDASTLSHWLRWTRNVHPLIAIGFAMSVFYIGLFHVDAFGLARYRRMLISLVLVNVLAGASNILWHDQPWTQVVHVLLAHLLWLVLVLAAWATDRQTDGA
jgi:heme A synthase